MVDLNEWHLTYPGVDFEFGTHESGFPFTKQVAVGVVATETSDRPHPTSPGSIPGVDRSRGRILTFAGAHLDHAIPDNTHRWTHALDLGGDIEAAWAADTIVEQDGAVAELFNIDRNRVVYGRPRNYAPTLDGVRHGWSTWSGEFHMTDPLFYDLTEQAERVTTAAGVVGGITFPVTFPVTTTTAAVGRGWVVSVGKRTTWPVITIDGPCTNPTVTLLDAGGSVRWSLTVLATLGVGQTVTIDTRPWVRTVDVNGGPGEGLLRGSQLVDCRIPPGTSELRFTATADPSGTAGVELAWRDAFPSL